MLVSLAVLMYLNVCSVNNFVTLVCCIIPVLLVRLIMQVILTHKSDKITVKRLKIVALKNCDPRTLDLIATRNNCDPRTSDCRKNKQGIIYPFKLVNLDYSKVMGRGILLAGNCGCKCCVNRH